MLHSTFCFPVTAISAAEINLPLSGNTKGRRQNIVRGRIHSKITHVKNRYTKQTSLLPLFILTAADMSLLSLF